MGERGMRVLMAGPPVWPPSGGMASVAATIAAQHVDGVTVVPLHSGGGAGTRGWARYPAALRAVARPDYDVLHLHLASYGSTLRKAGLAAVARRTGRPYVIHLHGGGYERFLDTIPPSAGARVAEFFRGAQAVVVLGATWQDVPERLGVAPERIHVVPNGVPAVTTADRTPGSDPTILFVGTVNEAKGVPELIDAAVDLLAQPQFSSWRVRLLGPVAEPLQQLLAEVSARTGGRVVAEGVVLGEAKAQAFADADVFVLPSHTENMPIVLLEAMSAGLPVVATPVGAITEALTDGETGIVVPVRDTRALTSVLGDLMADPARRAALGAAGRSRWESTYTASAMAGRLAQIWKACAVTTTPAETSLVSVVVPTIGRPSLSRALASVAGQDLPDGVTVEAVVVNDSGSPLDETLLPDGLAVRVVDTPGRVGAAAARNAGLAASTGELIALLDDDDLWLPGHVAATVQYMAAHPETTILFCTGLALDTDGTGRLEPGQPLEDRTLAEFMFEVSRWRSRSRRILTSGIVVRYVLRDHEMETGLRQSEDSWWLLTAERRRGARVRHSPHVGVVMLGSSVRTSSRDAEREPAAWAARLEELVPGAGAAHLNGVRGRDLARAGRPRAVIAAARDASEFSGSWRWTGVVVGHAALATAKAAVQAVRTVRTVRSGRGR